MDSNKGKNEAFANRFISQGYHPRSSSDANFEKAFRDCVKPPKKEDYPGIRRTLDHWFNIERR